MSDYTPEHHPRTVEVIEGRYEAVAPPAPRKPGTAYGRFNDRVAIVVTRAVGSMTCAYIFGLLSFVSLPAVLSTHSTIVLVQWVAQTFFQLVLLSVILVGQNIAQESSDRRADATYEDAHAVLVECIEIHRHLGAQDRQNDAELALLSDLVTRMEAIAGGPQRRS